MIPSFLRARPGGVLLSIKLQPRASADEIVPPGKDSTEMRIRVSAPPVDAAANEALIRLLAEWLDCSRGSIELVHGHKSRHKTLMLHGVTADEVLSRF